MNLEKTIDDFINASYEDKAHIFYELCKDDKNLFYIENILSNNRKDLIDMRSYLLCAGFLGSIENSAKFIYTLLDGYLESHNVFLEEIEYGAIYNCVLKHNRIDILNKLNESGNLLEEEGAYIYDIVDQNGKLKYMVVFSEDEETVLSEYTKSKNVISYCIQNEIEYPFILAQEKKLLIQPSIVEYEFLLACIYSIEEEMTYMLSHPYMGEVLENSSNIAKFLFETTQYQQEKEKALYIKSKINRGKLNEKLNDQLSHSKSIKNHKI